MGGEGEGMSDHERQFWVAIRAALLAIVDAIERYAEIGKRAKPVALQPTETDNMVVVSSGN